MGVIIINLKLLLKEYDKICSKSILDFLICFFIERLKHFYVLVEILRCYLIAKIISLHLDNSI